LENDLDADSYVDEINLPRGLRVKGVYQLRATGDYTLLLCLFNHGHIVEMRTAAGFSTLGALWKTVREFAVHAGAQDNLTLMPMSWRPGELHRRQLP
jgi:hypothetical protein